MKDLLVQALVSISCTYLRPFFLSTDGLFDLVCIGSGHFKLFIESPSKKAVSFYDTDSDIRGSGLRQLGILEFLNFVHFF